MPTFGPLQRHPRGTLEVPAGFDYHVVSSAGALMTDGFHVPLYPAGQGAFQQDATFTVLMRNHDVPPGTPSRSGPFGFQNHRFTGSDAVVYDAGADGTKPAYGAVTSVLYHTREGWVAETSLRLGGLLGASLGGPAPWGRWLCCESVVRDPDDRYAEPHGYVFEVPVEGKASAEPLRALGRFAHAAVAVDPRSGIVYQTEARPDGLLYRFVPAEPGRLDAGRLQALAVSSTADPRRWGVPTASAHTLAETTWIDLDEPDGADTLRERGQAAGATPFADGSALCFHDDVLYVACRTGGPEGRGQLWRYIPSPAEGQVGESAQPGPLALAFAPDATSRCIGLDVVAVAPWGDLLLSGTDTGGTPYLIGRTATGTLYPLARNVADGARFVGATFAPDGAVLFINLREAGTTLALTGPWPTT